jgi:uncharacterized protein
MNGSSGPPNRRNSRRGPGRNSGPPVPIRPRSGGGRLWWILAGVLVVIIVIPSILTEMITDWMWFGSQNLAEVYTTRLWLGLGVFFGAGLFAGIFCWMNWAWAWRTSQPDALYPGQRESISRGLARVITAAAAFFVGLILGLIAAEEWPTILLYLNGGSFGQADPLFNNDIGFYVFGLPFYRLLRGWSLVLLVATAIGVGVIYLVSTGISEISRQIEGQRRGDAPRFRFNLSGRVGTHLSVLGAIFLLLVAVGYWLGRYDLLYSSRAVAYGAGYADINAKLPSFYIMMVIAVVAAVLLLINTRVRTWRLLVGAFGAWLLALILVSGVYPAVVQEFVVRPSELALELPYIQNNIAATRSAFGLDKFREREVPAVSSLTAQQVEENRSVADDIRLWDYRPLLDTFGQLQEIRSYYSFIEVDIDRYRIDGRTRQVMLSPREISSAELSDQVRTWQNRHLVYTHGYGAVAASVNEIEGEGLPRLLLKNVPPETGVAAFKLTRPEIYYGELTDDYVFVNSGTPEFDYPQGDTNKFTTYAGKGGVALSNFLTKLLFAVRFSDGNVLLSSYITPETRLLFHRNIHDAVRLLAPFLRFDHDPYLVISEGQLYWLQDAYTVSSRYPYSSPYNDDFNYIRNSVKVAINAYDGSATFYVADDTDPIIRAYRGIFPALFKDISAMPADLRSHVRYPEDLLNIQANMYGTFHMTDPQVFYTKEDVWTVPFGTQSEGTEPLEAYYTILRLPNETAESFRLILPFTPRSKDNMIAWMAANSDGANYGQVDVIRYPKQQLVYGPRQIEARIDQDPIISQQMTLWNQSGSSVRRGNLLVIPIASSVLYVEPLFLQAVASKFPELKRVIVATGDRIGFGSDLDTALDNAMGVAGRPPIVGGGDGTPNATPVPDRTPLPGETPVVRSAADLTQSALQHYDRAQQALRQGDWATYGREIDAMKSDLDALALLTGVPTPAPSPLATPTP